MDHKDEQREEIRLKLIIEIGEETESATDEGSSQAPGT